MHRFPVRPYSRPTLVSSALRTCLPLVALCATTSTVLAVDRHWVVGSGVWSNPAHWSPFGVPGPADFLFIGSTDAAENEAVTLNANAAAAFLSITDGMRVNSDGFVLTCSGPIVVSGANSVPPVLYSSSLRVDNGPAAIDVSAGSLTVSDGGRLRMEAGRLHVAGALVLEDTTSLYGDGVITLSGNATPSFLNDGFIQVAPGSLTLIQQGSGRIDLDGTVADGTSVHLASVQVVEQAFPHLTIDGTGLADPFSDEMSLASGASLTMLLDEPWRLGPGGEIRVVGFTEVAGVAVLSGAPFEVAGLIETGGTEAALDVQASTTFLANAQVLVESEDTIDFATSVIEAGSFLAEAGGTLHFNGPTTVEGGSFTTLSSGGSEGRIRFMGPTSYDGAITVAGLLAQAGPAEVVGPTTVAGGRFDLDGPGATASWTILNALALNVERIDQLDNAVHAPITIDSGFLGKLTVQLSQAPASWRAYGDLRLAGVAALPTTRIAGAPLEVSGDLFVKNAVRIDAPLTFDATSTTTFETASSRLLLPKASVVEAGATFGGGGRIESAAGGELLLEHAADLDATDLDVAGTLEIGSPVGVAFADRLVFQNAATFMVDIAGPAAGLEHDQILLSGTGNVLAGSIKVSQPEIGGMWYAPTVGESFLAIVAPPGSITGSFTNQPISSIPGSSFRWQVDIQTGEVASVVRLTVVEVVPCPADLSGDGAVDASDLAMLLGAWGACGACAEDLDGDGMVAAADLAILLGSWGGCLD
jgi:hypothetical protein